MKEEQKVLRFFLGANTPQGFVSRFDHLTDNKDGWRTLIIKGGPGSGKSTMMKKIAAGFPDESVELIYCSSDIESLDAVILADRRFAIADGTAPHILEPRYPGAAESIVDFTSFWDGEALYASRGEIIKLTKSCTRCHEHCCRFLSAAASLVGDTYRLALEAVNTAKLSAYCARLCERVFKPVAGRIPHENVRFLTAVTNKGVTSFYETAKQLCERIYLISDDYGAVSRLMLNNVRAAALAAGYDVISCYCPLSPYEKLEQLFVPQLSLGFMTSNRFHDFTDVIDPYRIVNSQRFSDQSKLKANKRRITFNRRAAAQMIEQAASLLSEAKRLHDELETYYIAATDFEKTDAATEKIIEKLKDFPPRTD